MSITYTMSTDQELLSLQDNEIFDLFDDTVTTAEDDTLEEFVAQQARSWSTLQELQDYLVLPELGHPPLPAARPPLASNHVPAASNTPATPGLDNVKIVMLQQAFHRIDKGAAATEDVYVVTNTKTFKVFFELRDARTERPVDVPLEIKATLMYENGHPVPPERPDCPLLEGTTRATFRGGRCVLEPKILPLSTNHNKKRFCLLVEPVDPQLAAEHPGLSMKTIAHPLKTVTKLIRSPNDPRRKGPVTSAATPPATAPPAPAAAPPAALPSAVVPPAAAPTAPAPTAATPLAAVKTWPAQPQARPINTTVRVRGGEARPSDLGEIVSEEELRAIVRQQRQEIQQLMSTNQAIFEELRALRAGQDETAGWFA